MIDARIANNIIGFMERAPLKAGAEVPAYNEAYNGLHKVIAEEKEANRLEAELLKLKNKDKGKKKTPKPGGDGADGGEKKS